jgi:WD40 repeat protein
MASLKAMPEKDALKTNATKHSGQQSLTVRSDGKIFATAGWDGRMRIYSIKSLKEVAVLKWHKEGCYAVAFAEIAKTADARVESSKAVGEEDPMDEQSLLPVSAARQVSTIRQQRENRTKNTHWLAAGSKDGKVSLWDVF